MPEVPKPEDCPLREDFWPDKATIHDRLEQRFVPGGDPLGTGRAQTWMRPLNGGAAEPGCLAVLADLLPGVTHRVFEAENNTNSIDNVVRIHRLVDTDWVLLDHQLIAVDHGAFHARGNLFTADGVFLASCSQSGIIRFPDLGR